MSDVRTFTSGSRITVAVDNKDAEAAAAAALTAAATAEQTLARVEQEAGELFGLIPPRVVTASTTAQAGETLLLDTRGGTFTVTLPATGIVTIRMPESLNPVAATLNAGGRTVPDLSDFTGYAVQLYPLDADTIAIQPLGYIYEEAA